MNTTNSIFLLLLFQCVVCFSQVEFQEMSLKQLDELEQVKTSKKKMLVYFTKEWCPACRALEKQVFKNEKMSKFINNTFICFKVDQNNNEAKEIHYRCNIPELFPTVLFLEKSGAEIDRIIGFGDKNKFYNELVDYSINKNTMHDLLERTKSEPDNGELYFKLAQKYESHRNLKEQLFYMRKTMNYDPFKSKPHYWFNLCLLYEKDNDIPNAIKSLKTAIKLAPDNSHYAGNLTRLENKM